MARIVDLLRFYYNMARKVDFDPFKIHFTRNQSEEGGGAWRMARKRVKWIYPFFLAIFEFCIKF